MTYKVTCDPDHENKAIHLDGGSCIHNIGNFKSIVGKCLFFKAILNAQSNLFWLYLVYLVCIKWFKCQTFQRPNIINITKGQETGPWVFLNRRHNLWLYEVFKSSSCSYNRAQQSSQQVKYMFVDLSVILRVREGFSTSRKIHLKVVRSPKVLVSLTQVQLLNT